LVAVIQQARLKEAGTVDGARALMSELLCHRCGRPLTPGRGDFYVVRIEAQADPTPTDISEAELAGDTAGELSRLIEQMRESDATEQEWMDQVHRRMTLHLCNACYRRWIEDPAGRDES
jgi:predicted amidophosphoribosyltransferase